MASVISNAKSRAPALPYLREGVSVALVLAGLCALLMGVNAYLDPFDLGLSPLRAEVDRRMYAPRNLPLRAVVKLRRLPPSDFARARYVILGDSRARQLSASGWYDDEDLVIEIAGAPVLNLAFGGASIAEAIDMFAGFEGDLDSLRAIILGTPIDELGILRAGRRVGDALDLAARPWRYLLNLNTTIAFFEPVKWTPGRKRVAEGSALWQKTVRGYRARTRSLNRRRAERQLRANIDRLRAAARRNVELIFYIPPMAAALERAYAERGNLYRYILERLSERGTVYDYALSDGVGSSFELADPAHLLNGSRPILDDLLARFEGRRKVSRFAAGGVSPSSASGR